MGQILQDKDGGYTRFLEMTAKALLPLEQALDKANVSAVLPDWAQRSRSAALRADLAALSVAAPDARGAYCDPLLRNEAYQFGILYVLEGSRLGALMILREIQKAPAPVHARAMRYLTHGEGQPLWQTFLKQLEASRAAERNPGIAVAGATAAFEMFLPQDAYCHA
jgi:heme oxygenase